MDTHHITNILDNTPLSALSESELRRIRAHIANCVDCAQAFDAAQLSSLLMKQRAVEAAQSARNADPFFQTRVLAAWREQQERGWSLGRLWKATGVLVSSMIVTTAALAALTFVAPAEESPAPTAMASRSAESVMFDQSEEEMANEQALNAIYYDDDEAR
jgi:anti-sigma-K factor RskA